jgi:hypothetical protein
VSDMPDEAARVAVEDAGAAEIQIRIWYSAEKGDECFVAQVVESSQREAVRDGQAKRGARRELGSSSQWLGIMAHGDTREDAARPIQLALDGALEVAAERGLKPPVPSLAHAS